MSWKTMLGSKQARSWRHYSGGRVSLCQKWEMLQTDACPVPTICRGRRGRGELGGPVQEFPPFFFLVGNLNLQNSPKLNKTLDRWSSKRETSVCNTKNQSACTPQLLQDNAMHYLNTAMLIAIKCQIGNCQGKSKSFFTCSDGSLMLFFCSKSCFVEKNSQYA